MRVRSPPAPLSNLWYIVRLQCCFRQDISNPFIYGLVGTSGGSFKGSNAIPLKADGEWQLLFAFGDLGATHFFSHDFMYTESYWLGNYFMYTFSQSNKFHGKHPLNRKANPDGAMSHWGLLDACDGPYVRRLFQHGFEVRSDDRESLLNLSGFGLP